MWESGCGAESLSPFGGKGSRRNEYALSGNRNEAPLLEQPFIEFLADIDEGLGDRPVWRHQVGCMPSRQEKEGNDPTKR